MKAIVAMLTTASLVAATRQAASENIPAIDAAQPKEFQTATFAVG